MPLRSAGLTDAHVLGAGALGSLFAAHLASVGVRTTMLLREGKPGGRLWLRVNGGASENGAFVRTEPASGPGSAITTLIVATKAHTVREAVERVAPRLDHGAPSSVVLLSNGALAVAGELRLPPTTSLLVATTTHGAFLEQPPGSAGSGEVRKVRHSTAGVGSCWVGPLPRPMHRSGGRRRSGGGAAGALVEDAAVAAAQIGGGAARLVAARERRLERHGRQFVTSTVAAGLGGELEDWQATERRLWLELAANAVIDPLSAVWNVRNGLVLDSLLGRHLAREVVSEIAALALALAVRGLSDAAPSSHELYSFVEATAEASAANFSSMHQDVMRGRLTEVDELNGWVAARATALGLPCVHNEWLAQVVKERQSLVYAGV